MNNPVKGQLIGTGGGQAIISAEIDTELLKSGKIKGIYIYYDDGERISREQQKKIYAIFAEIADWSGHIPEYIKERMKMDYLSAFGGDWFSLANCSKDRAREFINFLIDFCFYHDIQTPDTFLKYTEDTEHYLYACLVNRKCCICNKKAEIHHCEGSRVGMGLNRNRIDNIGRYAIALCQKHHQQAHNDEKGFMEKNHVYGIKLDEYLVRRLGL